MLLPTWVWGIGVIGNWVNRAPYRNYHRCLRPSKAWVIIRGIGTAGRPYEISNCAGVKCVPRKTTTHFRSREIFHASKFPE